jgi:preprotein translocase subunit SecA
MMRVQVQRQEEAERMEAEYAAKKAQELLEAAARHGEGPTVARAQPQPAPALPASVRRKAKRIGPNDPCPCGSGKKFKKCHGAATSDESAGSPDAT